MEGPRGRGRIREEEEEGSKEGELGHLLLSFSS